MILLLLLFNWFVLWVVLDMVSRLFVPNIPHGAQAAAHAHNVTPHITHHISSFSQFFTYYHLYISAILAALIICGLVWLFYSGAGQWLLRFFCKARMPIERERKKIYPVINRVQQAVEEKLGLKAIDKIYLMVTDSPLPGTAALGRNTVIINSGLYETATEDELAGAIAHEMAHLHNGDSMRLQAALGVSTITLLITSGAAYLYSFASRFTAAYSKGEDMNLFAVSVGFVLMLFLGFFLLFVKGGSWIIDFALLFQGTKEEYKADEFAVKAGFGSGLLSLLEKTKDFRVDGRRTVGDKFYTMHPSTMLRIGRLEECLKAGE